jgi:hypothetical protein
VPEEEAVVRVFLAIQVVPAVPAERAIPIMEAQEPTVLMAPGEVAAAAAAALVRHQTGITVQA